jgi:prepilin-type N-terminal cleavage/methylation domain-containing protein
MRPSRPRRTAFTLVELLVVIAIIGVLIGMLLPAVQKVRDVANRVQSENNLRQIGLAASNYQSANGALPDNKALLDKSNSSTRSFSSVFVKLLPYAEQNNLYQAALDQGIRALDGATVKHYVSPADGSVKGNTGAFTSYVANDAIFGIKDGGSLTRSIPDGLSETVLFTEHFMASSWPPVYNSWVIATDGIPVNRQLLTRAARLVSTAPPQFGRPQQCSADPASTPHTSGILTAMADGSVRSVAAGSAMAPASMPGGSVTNWQAALSPAGGETLGPDW